MVWLVFRISVTGSLGTDGSLLCTDTLVDALNSLVD